MSGFTYDDLEWTTYDMADHELSTHCHGGALPHQIQSVIKSNSNDVAEPTSSTFMYRWFKKEGFR